LHHAGCGSAKDSVRFCRRRQLGVLHSLAAHGIVGDMAFGSSVGYHRRL
jgi:hypothetical protein